MIVTDKDRQNAHQICLDYEQVGFEEATRTLVRICAEAVKSERERCRKLVLDRTSQWNQQGVNELLNNIAISFNTKDV